jgi:hypothetical protein
VFGSCHAIAMHREAIQLSRSDNASGCPVMFDLTDGGEPVLFRRASWWSSLNPQPISHYGYDISTWCKLVRVSHGRFEPCRHRAHVVLAETT